MTDVFITRKIFPEAIALLDQAHLSYHHDNQDTCLNTEQIQAEIGQAKALICLLTDKIDAAIMDAAPHLKVIANVAVGYDNIDVEAASERGIVVTNTPDVLTEATADLAFTLILAVARRIPEADQYMRTGQFNGWELFQPHLGSDVYGKTLGIVGMGRIGTAVARRGALGFGMNVLYTATHPKPEVETELDANFVSLPELLGQSDFISLHVPLMPETVHLLTMREFQLMKQSAFVINTARGPIIKEDDLVSAIEQGIIQGAGLDVFEHEPKIHTGLAKLEKHVVVVPHIGSATVETRRRMSMVATKNVVVTLAGKTPPNALNPEVLKS